MITDIEKLKRELSLYDVLSVYGFRTRGISGEINCPFHNDSHPSMHYDFNEESFYCHGRGCDAQGDISNFIQRYEHCDFKESILIANRILEGRTLLKKPAKTKGKKAKNIIKKPVLAGNVHPKRTIAALTAIINIFSLPEEIAQNYLMDSGKFKITLRIFENNRMKFVEEDYYAPGFSAETIKKYKIAYCGTTYKKQKQELLEMGFTEEELVSSGVFKKNQAERVEVPRYIRGRILYPFLTENGVVQIAARAIDGSLTSNKYSKTKKIPEVNQVFNIDITQEADSILLTEGVTDCIRANEIGIPSLSPVAKDFTRSSFRALTEKLKRKKVFICFDTDKNESGQKGAKSTQEHLLEYGIESIIIELPEPKCHRKKIDVCEFINEEGAEAFYKLCAEHGFSFHT